jgi:phage major head subunit gpT-like protein
MGMNGVAGGIKLEAAVTAYSTVAADVFKSGGLTDLGPLIARRVPCGGTRFEVDALGVVPAVEEIIGTRSFANLRAYVNSAAVKKYGPKALEFKLIDIENDPSGLIPAKLGEYATGMSDWLDAPLWNFIFGNPTCLDASALFSTTHPYGAAGATWSNTTTSALSPSTFFTGISAMASLVYENNEPAGYYPDVLMVGPDNEKMATDLCGPDRIVPIAATGLEAYSSAVAAAAKSNWAAGKIKVVINPRMIGTYNDYWYLIDTKREGARPIVIGDAKAFQAYTVTDPQSEPMVQRSAAQFYAEGYAGLMGGVPYSIYGGLTA